MTRARTGSETQILSAFLDQQREVVLWKLDGLTDEQLRQPIKPGGLIEETTRHAGHANFIREHLDGTTGHLPGELPY